ncbi:ThuA domain-containing protein [Parapedobacter koreensis]|uniref:Glucose/arabinose dehydrogenase, beta-propeller fold n=1 Tax=Parapedobacter koreensis TaxID=332977 RepID=A0A1H7L2X3_9SPHI|nr:ThuA domain-containing protein [Parapedobacter koreensis]SEK93150.1 Glucose/arabinose dehydrogenase, beta-propeller fold [Parapedobacter koreensis]
MMIQRWLKFFTVVRAMLLLAGMSVFLQTCSDKREGNPRILVFSKTAAFYHESIPAGNAALLKMGANNGIDVDTTTDANRFNEDSLKQYSAVVFLSTTGDILDQYQEVALERYIQSGGGFVGIHAANDAEYDWGWYGRLVGAYFQDHPRPQEARFRVVNSQHPATEGLPETFTYADEWYNFKRISPDIKVLITIDEHSYEGGTHGDSHPMAWYHDFDGGRSFFTAFGHSAESFQDSLQLRHILGGIRYAIGNNEKLDYRKAKSKLVPERKRFVKTQLMKGELFEPTEMALLPNSDILVAQRRGELLLYQQATGTIKQVGQLDVYHRTEVPNVNAEEGLLGMALDPAFEKNNYVYLFYSPTDTSVNRLSRFVYDRDTLDRASEQVILQFYSQRDICCHTGGSIAFGSDGLLYLSTGDNSTPFDQPDPSRYKNQGFAPMDGRSGFEQYDARRSSGNTNDLRGKILRINVLADGTYDIPEGNLFAVGQQHTRPEIYVMGTRNPYRISVDPKTNFLYWGEVGPDAGEDRVDTRGPRGYDEVNQAREAGFFGWPFFVGANYAYRSYDYGTGQSGPLFDPEGPANTSPNNTGLNRLPPAQPAFIWYPYAASPDFPQVGTGGRNAMAGPVYHVDRFPKATRYPDYYDDKLVIYDWVRGWVKVVTMLPNGDFDRLEPFMEGESFASPIDMEVGRDGRLYVLEYGKGWYSKNPDAGIARIDYYPDNIPPKIGGLTVDRNSGDVPFTVNARVDVMDDENDPLTYQWHIDGVCVQTDGPMLTHTLETVGEHGISVTVEDSNSGRATSSPILVYAGNDRPAIDILVANPERTFHMGDAIAYEVRIDDGGRAINPDNLVVTVDYLQGTDLAGASTGHQQASQLIEGRSLMQASDCQSCHKLDEPSIGPSFMQVATRYRGKHDSPTYLVEKVVKGGSGVWGEVAMAAHPDMKEAEAQRIVQWILSLAEISDGRKSLPAKGIIIAKPPFGNDEPAVLRITAQYTNAPEPGIRPLTGVKTLDLTLVGDK